MPNGKRRDESAWKKKQTRGAKNSDGDKERGARVRKSAKRAYKIFRKGE